MRVGRARGLSGGRQHPGIILPDTSNKSIAASLTRALLLVARRGYRDAAVTSCIAIGNDAMGCVLLRVSS